ncbi:hypothetical protein HK097_009424 [Rhizophlyctis rosea]|uniref:Bet v1-like protein n=1 Tax=Rhizophlyctis rosea TaxID=64517 RepID=A0AAD5X4L1_9FUNG|nr:hypothetical protein HK097_009424 [Rhizophlyctis rosea]
MSSTRVWESRVFPATADVVWTHIRPADFKFWSAVKEATVENGNPGEVGSIRKITFKDGTVQKYQLVELSDLHKSVTYEIIESNPPVPILAAVHTIRVKKITHDNSTLVEWESDYSSSDNTVNVIEDSRFKKQEAFEDLHKAVAKK